MIRNYTARIWYFNLKTDNLSTKIMPSGNRITQAEHGVLITGKGFVRWISNSYFDDVDTDSL